MVHQTFLNLPAEKRDRIVESAREEFSSQEYEKTNINRIVQNAGIPKGSFYQYFDSKEDLFAYCIRQLYQQILEARLKKGETLLDTGMKRASLLGIEKTIPIYNQEIQELIGERNLRFLQSMMQAPKQIRNFVLLDIAENLVMPELRRELEEDHQVRKDRDLDYYAYLLSAGEMIAIEYGTLKGIPVNELNAITYQYMSAVYNALLVSGEV